MFGVTFSGKVSGVEESFNRNLKKFTTAIFKRFEKLDGWTIEQE